MEFGVCGGPEVARIAGQLGYDFTEWTVADLLKPRESADAFGTALAQAKSAALPYPVANQFVPGDLKITGPDVDSAALESYVTTVMTRAEKAGIEVIVFGSGGARAVPDGWDRASAGDQLLAFGSMVAPIAADHGVTVVVEPLNQTECNVLNSVAEGAQLVRAVDHPGLRLLVDGYHLMKDNDSYEDIVSNGDLICHVHIATIPNRRAPAAEPCDMAPFFAALRSAGYDRRVSIEGRIPEPEVDLPGALQMMRMLAS